MSTPATSGRQTYTFTNAINPNLAKGIIRPVAVAVDSATNVYVLNRGTNGTASLQTNGTLLKFNIDYLGYPVLVATNATRLTNATAMAVDGLGNIFVTVQSNTVLKITQPNTISVAGYITNPGVNLQGIVVMDNGQLALSDAGTNSGIWLMNPYSGNITNNVTKLAGFNSTGDNVDIWPVHATNAIFNHPANIAKAGNGILVITDKDNHRVKLLNTVSSTVTLFYGVQSNLWLTGKTILPGNYIDPGGWVDAKATNAYGGAESRLPFGAVVAPDGSVYVSEDYCHLIRHVTGTGLSAPAPGFPRTGVQGIGLDPTGNNLYIASPLNNQVRVLNIPTSQTSAFLTAADGLDNPVSVLTDTNGSYDGIYYIDVLNSGTNGFILQFESGSGYGGYNDPYYPLITGLNQPTAFTMDGTGNLFIAELGGAIKVVVASTGISNTIVTITNNANVQLQGIAILDNGNIAVSDAGNHVIWSVNPITKLYHILTGQLGISGSSVGSTNVAKLNQPHQLARTGSQLLVADSGLNRLVMVTASGTTTTNLNPNNATLWFGNANDPITSTGTNSSQFLPMNAPIGLAVNSPDGIIYDSEPTNQAIRRLMTGTNWPPAVPVAPLPFFSAIAGIALNSMSTELFITDPTNNTVSVLNLANNQTSLFLDSYNGIYQPVDVAVDSSDNIFVLNQGTGGNGSIFKFDSYGNLLGTNASGLSLPTAMKLSFTGDIYVTEQTGAVKKFYAGGSNAVLATVNNTNNVQLQGITLLNNGSVVVSDAGNHVLWKIAPSATNAVLFTGVINTAGTNFGPVGFAKLNKPMRMAQALGGLLLIADSGNNRVVVCDNAGIISSALKSTNASLWFGNQLIDPVSSSSPYFVSMLSPVSIAIGTNGVVFDSETIYKNIRGILNTGIHALIAPPPAPLNLSATATLVQIDLSWSPLDMATNYNVKRSPSTGGPYTTIAITTGTTYNDTNIINGSTYYYVVSASNAGGEGPDSAEVNATPPYPNVPDPQIGYVDFPATASPTYTSVFHPFSTKTFNDNAFLVIKGTFGSETFYTSDGTDPQTSPSRSSVNSDYQDGKNLGSVSQYLVPQSASSFTIRAVGIQTNHPNSAVIQATVYFKTGTPTVIGNNAAQFFIQDITTGAELYYTTDGSDPSFTNASAVHLLPVATPTNQWTVGFTALTNTTFKVRAVRPLYQDSEVASIVFSPTNFVANVISFGFANNEEASSDFVASPGQTFYSPVTLSLLPNTSIYGLAFALTATNGGANPGPAITSGAFSFKSMLMKPILGVTPVLYEPIPVGIFIGTNFTPVTLSDSTNFASMLVTNTANNLLGVGWLERAGKTNLFDTTSQDLIKFSMAHDTMFLEGGNKIIVGGYSFQVPITATNGQTYQIQIGRQSANSDGIGAPGSDVYVSAPTNGSLAGGLPLNALKQVTVG
ncbi:MAG: FN3 associated domain-containing protein, partial [Verrucomicrobiota bacterium]